MRCDSSTSQIVIHNTLEHEKHILTSLRIYCFGVFFFWHCQYRHTKRYHLLIMEIQTARPNEKRANAKCETEIATHSTRNRDRSNCETATEKDWSTPRCVQQVEYTRDKLAFEFVLAYLFRLLWRFTLLLWHDIFFYFWMKSAFMRVSMVCCCCFFIPCLFHSEFVRFILILCVSLPSKCAHIHAKPIDPGEFLEMKFKRREKKEATTFTTKQRMKTRHAFK